MIKHVVIKKGGDVILIHHAPLNRKLKVSFFFFSLLSSPAQTPGVEFDSGEGTRHHICLIND